MVYMENNVMFPQPKMHERAESCMAEKLGASRILLLGHVSH